MGRTAVPSKPFLLLTDPHILGRPAPGAKICESHGCGTSEPPAANAAVALDRLSLLVQ